MILTVSLPKQALLQTVIIHLFSCAVFTRFGIDSWHSGISFISAEESIGGLLHFRTLWDNYNGFTRIFDEL